MEKTRALKESESELISLDKAMPKLSKNQERAVTYGKGPLMVLAGPGSGKTFVITMRVKYIIENLKINPCNILVLTFSRSAAKEMKERFLKISDKTESYASVTWGTFHAVFFAILRAAYGYNANQVISDNEKYSIIKELIQNHIPEYEEASNLIPLILEEIALVKEENIDIRYYYSKNCLPEIFKALYKEYEAKLAILKKIDFEDMLLMSYELLLKREDIRQVYNQRFKYILVDEFQDINRLQYEVVKLLAGKAANLTIVGDDDQSIYGFRGARPEIMLGFKKDYHKAEIILLNINFRSGAHIVRSAQKLISYNKERFKKNISAARGSLRPPEIIEYATPIKQFRAIIEDIKGYIKSGCNYNDIAVLYRTNIQPRLLTKLFMEDNIPFIMKDNIPDLYSHWIAKDIISYLKAANESAGIQDWLRIINHPNRYIKREALKSGNSFLEALYAYYSNADYMLKRIDELKHNLLIIRSLTTLRAIKYIRLGLGYDAFVKEYSYERSLDEEDFFTVLSELEVVASNYAAFEDWFAYIEAYRLELAKKHRAKPAELSEGVRLMTFHSAKGLEYPIVYIIDVNKGITPYKKAVSKADIEEERRMFYVAMTRARDRLFLCTCKSGFHGKTEPSIFLKELLF